MAKSDFWVYWRVLGAFAIVLVAIPFSLLAGLPFLNLIVILSLSWCFPVSAFAYLLHQDRISADSTSDIGSDSSTPTFRRDLERMQMEEETIDSLCRIRERAYSRIVYYHHLLPVTALAMIGFSIVLWPPSAPDAPKSLDKKGPVESDPNKVESEPTEFDPTPESESFLTRINWGGSTNLKPETLEAMKFGFLGAFVFVIQLLLRRFTTNDLLPSVYLHCAIVLACGLAFNFVAFEAISSLAKSDDDKSFAGMAAILAFSLGYFPTLAVEWISRNARRVFQVDSRREASIPLARVRGISDLHEVRLREEGIDNLQNLSACDVGRLVINTPFGAGQLMEWIDQAILCLYLDPTEIERFRTAGILAFSDLRQRVLSQQPEVVAEILGVTTERLKGIHEGASTGPNRRFVLSYFSEPATGKQASAFLEVLRQSEKPMEDHELVAEIGKRGCDLSGKVSSVAARLVANGWIRCEWVEVDGEDSDKKRVWRLTG